ncbi:MAG: type II toxin-antitoxin system VapC family toxin [Actinobacteria bacterium]|nr:type II toxin-antitoxin system VapC family toxin [Actinomycetota bacterium]
MHLVDSSGWLEFFADGPLAAAYEEHLLDPAEILTPTLVVHEVYKWLKRERSEEEALVAVAQLDKTEVVPLTATIALTAADLALEHRLATADAVVYATGILHQAPVVTSDSDFEGLPGVVFLGR